MSEFMCSQCGSDEGTIYACGSCGGYFCAACVVRGNNSIIYCPQCSPQCYVAHQG